MTAHIRSIRRSTRAFALSVVLAASAGHAFSLWPEDLSTRGELYTIHGYLDRAPEERRILDRIEVRTDGKVRTLLVTWYGTPGETMLDRHLSRNMSRRYTIHGSREEVRRLAGSAPGTKIRGMFTAYTLGPPWLRIAKLELTAAPVPRAN